MSEEIIAAILGSVLSGLITMIVTLLVLKNEFKNQKELAKHNVDLTKKEKHEDLRKEIINNFDMHLYTVQKIDNIELNEGKAIYGKDESIEIYYEVKKEMVQLENQLKELIGLIRTYDHDSIDLIQKMLAEFSKVDHQFIKFRKVINMYNNKYNSMQDDEKVNIAYSKTKLDGRLSNYLKAINDFNIKYFDNDSTKFLNEIKQN
ncbi:hypothetical protein [Abyssicoccus albus]|uniref:hypothetical protein n=1 Tax=Abyssicoccus albus TaxID=1817405 RepID=UPI00097E247E|nr:hypothetical protein [Abyssicoccus albus]AQL55908.1 hypothetical protein BVH56_02730 [Abyssicoccus albus]